MLSAKVEGYYHRYNDHHVVGIDGAVKCQDCKYDTHDQGDDGFYLQQIGQVLNEVFHTHFLLND